ncbi:CLUMA_CG001314, isoform A [Clunio marinus]|uniref:CLUMA_CG001314, isoform A n=1 Tax=Clunio marinus TaxID=568069 RepID=A0A1J1HMP8_9DIPT|nr:CLUMA_CG001314, isoform A [Clunio marinus]
MNKFHNILLEQCSKTVLKNISNFLKKDIREVKDYKQIFSKISENYDGALYKNSQVNKNRLQEIIEAENYVFSTKSQFQHSALDYVNYITMIQSKKRPEILSTLLSYVSACSTYFHQGSDLCQDYDTYLFKELDEEVTTMRNEYAQLEKTMQKRHNYVNGFLDEPKEVSDDNKVIGREMEGYLFKRTSNAFKTWNRRWFYMKDNKLYYRKRSGEDLPTIMEDDLKLCTVRPVTDSDRRFCFEVISPTKSHILQADSENQYQAWVQALHSGIGHAIQNNSRYSNHMCASSSSVSSSNPNPSSSMAPPANKPKEKRINWRQMLLIPGNMRCADCGSSDPKWASINLGITLCISCSGVHRSLGVHYSKKFVLPLNDENKKTELLPPNLLPSPSKWSVKKHRRRAARRHINNNNDMKITSKEHDNSEDEKEINESILILGNCLIDSNYSLIPETCSLFTNSDQESTSGEEDVLDEEEIDKLNPNYVLYKATTAHNLPVMCQAISLGADKNWENPDNLNRTPLHQAILSGSLMTCEFLLLNGANINCTDIKGYTPLHLSIEIGNTALAYLLLKHKAKYDLTTNDGKLPIDFAVATANADVVTLLRLHQLNEEIGATDDGEPGGDSTYNDVMRDFSHLANNQRLRTTRRDDGSSSSSSIANSNNMDNISMD